MVQSLEILYWALSILFCMAMGFAILLWCKSWRKEEREEADRRAATLSEEIEKLASAVDMLEHTAASLRTADEQLAQGIKDLKGTVTRNQRTAASATPAVLPVPDQEPLPEPSGVEMPAPASRAEEPATDRDRYGEARDLLRQGLSPTEVARRLDIGAAEAKMLARVIQDEGRSGQEANDG
jgi:hypothetical protein